MSVVDAPKMTKFYQKTNASFHVQNVHCDFMYIFPPFSFFLVAYSKKISGRVFTMYIRREFTQGCVFWVV